MIAKIRPATDTHWLNFLGRHHSSSVFHTPGWLNALQRTYNYEPLALVTSDPQDVYRSALVLCEVNSRITGCRIVSLPFSDHCQPLIDNRDELATLFYGLKTVLSKSGSIELRPLHLFYSPDKLGGLGRSSEFQLHSLDLVPDLDSLFRAFHKSCIQRKIRRAEREGLTYEEGRSPSILIRFYKLMVQTRRRHGMPPQPFRWFQNLADCLGENMTVRLLSKDGRPVASILTLTFKHTMTYKYGCSDARFHHLGGMPLLFWIAIQDAKKAGFHTLDLGRTDLDNPGLAQFKEHLGATRSSLTYYRFPAQPPESRLRTWATRTARFAFSHMPEYLLVPAGNLLYRHLG